MRNFRQNRGVFSLFMLIGLTAIVAAIMLLWNYLITPRSRWFLLRCRVYGYRPCYFRTYGKR